jgi:short-subunit dehydrogenase
MRTLAAITGGVLLARKLLKRGESFDDKVVVIGGGSRGLGLVLARAFAKRGAKLVLCARDSGELARAREELIEKGCEVETHVGDLSREADARGLVEAALNRFGRIDALVNLASIIQVGPFEAMGLHDLRDAMNANFWTTVHATMAALPELERTKGRIVNVTSIGGAVAVPHLLPYSAAKFAATGFSTGLHAEARSHGIRVTTVLPGLMRTGSFGHALVKGRREAEASWFSVAASTPILTMNAERAAERIVRAAERGVPYVTLGLPAKVLRLAGALFPSTVSSILAGVNALLPGPGTDTPPTRATPAEHHRRGVARSAATSLGDKAAREHNELGPTARDRVH